MIIEKLKEFAKNGQKNTDELDLEAGFSVNKKPARQWFNWLFNTLTLKINEIIDADYIQHDEIVDNLTTNDAKKPLSAKQGKGLQDSKLDKNENSVGLQVVEDRDLKPAELSRAVQAFFGTYNSDGGTNYCDFLTINGWHDRTGGFKNALVFNKEAQALYHFQASYDDESWTIKRQLAYADLLDRFRQESVVTSVYAPTSESRITITDRGWGVWSSDPAFNASLPLSAGGTGRTDGKAQALVNPRKIFGQTFDGSSDVNGTVTSSTGMFAADEYHYIDVGRNGLDRMNFYNFGGNFNFIDSSTGYILARLSLNGIDCNAATASKLQTVRKINGVDFDGTADITIPEATTATSGTVQLNDTLTSTSKTQALTANQGRAINDRFTTDFVNLKAANGHQKLPRGLIIQWGTGSTLANTVFPIVFPNGIFSVALAIQAGSSRADNIFYNSLTTSGLASWGRTPDGGEATLSFTYIAIGH